MSTTAVATTKGQGRKFFEKFQAWCDKNNLTQSPQLFEQWDTEVNGSGFKNAFWSEDYVYRTGLTALYTRAFYSYVTIRFESKGHKISLISTRSLGGGTSTNLLSGKVSKKELDTIRERAQIVLNTAAFKVKLFNLDKAEVLRMFAEALETAYQD